MKIIKGCEKMFKKTLVEQASVEQATTVKLDREQLEKMVQMVQWIARNPSCSYPVPPNGIIKRLSVEDLLQKFGL